jgi:glycosyltransferase involved in cell wall biosynthesis
MPDTILVFSHLRWDFVYQRPQHLLARMADRRRIIFFEEPIQKEGVEPYLEISSTEEGVTVCRPHTPSPHHGYDGDQHRYLNVLLRKLIADEKLTDNYIAWFYTPMALPLVRHLNPRLIVYDCMDELSCFLKAPRQLLQRESALLRVADLVFTGGPSLYEAKRPFHNSVHCFPSSVDASHFGKACDPSIEHRSQKKLARPRLGFFGVLDERLDLELLEAMAKAHPEWQIVLVGPVVKISPEVLPRLKNIHYLGKQQYAELPSYLCGWDVCLIPFALNEATRFISPTKTLEYMAAEKPIVSTPITDVEKPYGEIVLIGRATGEFITACEKALAMSNDERRRLVYSMRHVLARTSWDATVAAMDALINEALARKTTSRWVHHKNTAAARRRDPGA